MATANDIVADALADIGAVDPLEALTAAEASHGLRVLNELLESWSNEALAVYQILQENFATVAGTASYTIGSGATWNTPRPLRVESAFIRESGSDYPIDVRNREEYDTITTKTTRYRPEYLYYDLGVANGTVYLYGVPDAVYTVFLNSLKQLQSFADLTTTVVLPPGYIWAIKTNLALELAPHYQKTPSTLLAGIAREAKASVKRLNGRTPKLSVAHTAAFQGNGGFNIQRRLITITGASSTPGS